MTGQVWESIPESWRPLDDLERLARALRGEFNVITTAVQRDLLNRAQKAVRQRDTFQVHFAERTGDEQPDQDPIAAAASTARGPDQEAEARIAVETLAAFPEGRRILQGIAESDGDTLKSIAERLDLSPKWLTELVKRTKPRLADLL